VSDEGQPRAQPPEEAAQPTLREPKTYAGGLPAVLTSVKLAWRQMGAKRSLATLSNVNQMSGFDCPGCAWPEPAEQRSFSEFCENGAKAVAEEATLRRVSPAFFARWSLRELAEQSDHWLGQQGRLTHPMLCRPGADYYEPIPWDRAFELIARELHALSHPNEAIFYTSGRTSNEAAFLYQLFVRRFGTNNLPDCSNLCHESSGVGLTEAIGVSKGTVSLDDFAHADLIFVIGQNPGTNHPRMLSALQGAARNGCRIVSVNPLSEAGLVRFKHPQEVSGILGPGTKLASHFLRVRINGDVAAFQGIQKAMLELEPSVIDRQFIAEFTQGFAEHAGHLAQLSWAEIERSSGVSERELREVATLASTAKSTICCWAMGLTQHRNAVGNIQEVVNFLLLRGNLGRPGAGACPVRGHSNVQGDRTMGIWEQPPQAFLGALEREFGWQPPSAWGYDVVDSIAAMDAGKARIFVAMGGNFLSASPDTELTARALRKCRLTVHVSTKLNRAHLITGERALILPCLGRTEHDRGQFVTVEDSMGVVHRSQGKLAPASPWLLSEVQIVAGLARAVLDVDWKHLSNDYDRIRDHISHVVPGFERFNERVRAPAGFVLPHPVRDERRFPTASGRAIFTLHPLPRHELAEGRYLMMTIRSHDQYNTTIYGLDDRYRGIHGGRRIVLMNPGDIEAAKLSEGDYVDLVSHFRGEQRRAQRFMVVRYDIPPGCTATYFPEANVLVPLQSYAEKSQTPTSKSVVISLERSAKPTQA
jgi:molybdopterin-dependent oxidoreductase alpha subunit